LKRYLVKALSQGDQVIWNDPDDATCSRVYTIQTIQIIGDVVRIVDVDGSVLECFAQELT